MVIWIIILLIALAVVIAVALALRSRVKYLARELADTASELRVYKKLYIVQQEDLAEEGFKVLRASYAPAESDLLKYKNEKALLKGIKNRLAANLADYILDEFGLPEPDENGIYKYAVKAKRAL